MSIYKEDTFTVNTFWRRFKSFQHREVQENPDQDISLSHWHFDKSAFWHWLSSKKGNLVQGLGGNWLIELFNIICLSDQSYRSIDNGKVVVLSLHSWSSGSEAKSNISLLPFPFKVFSATRPGIESESPPQKSTLGQTSSNRWLVNTWADIIP